jgi:hypothetical protein
MISIDELADFTLRVNGALAEMKRRVQELESENKALKEGLSKLTPKE